MRRAVPAPGGVRAGRAPQPASAQEPFYLPVGRRGGDLRGVPRAAAWPVMLKGPTGCGKTRFVEHMAWRFAAAGDGRLPRRSLRQRPHRPLSGPGERDGVAGRSARRARCGRARICYLDEVVEARQDTVVVIHPLTDDRRMLPIDKTGELIEAAPGFQLVVSYNPGYQHVLKDLKPSTRQRFVALEFDFPPPELETRIVDARGRRGRADRRDAGGSWPAGSGSSATAGWPRCRAPACSWRRRGSSPAAYRPERPAGSAVAAPLTDEADLLAAIHDVIAAVL